MNQKKHPAQHQVEQSPLGKTSEYIDTYTPTLLYPIPRAGKRQTLGIQAPLPFHGADIWNCYELSWLTPSGKPAVALAEFTIAADSPHIIESKSFKLYLNSLNQTVFDSTEQLQGCLVKDLSHASGHPVKIRLFDINEHQQFQVTQPQGTCIDTLDTPISRYNAPSPELLNIRRNQPAQASLYSNLLKSNCPVTGQPDWGSLFIRYNAPHQLDAASLLQYIISFRQHADFHEHCVERIFTDLCSLLQPTQLEIYARYTRRGGLDINPYRTLNTAGHIPNNRLVRQ